MRRCIIDFWGLCDDGGGALKGPDRETTQLKTTQTHMYLGFLPLLISHLPYPLTDRRVAEMCIAQIQIHFLETLNQDVLFISLVTRQTKVKYSASSFLLLHISFKVDCAPL